MERCVIFGGTTEGRKLAEHFAGSSIPIDIYTATEYGSRLLPDAENIHPHAGRLDDEALTEALTGSALCVDATHPYACVITEQLRSICRELGIPYLRVSRSTSEERGDLCVSSMEEASEVLDRLPGNIFVTTGSRNVSMLERIRDYRERCFVRVLPDPLSLAALSEIGLAGRHVIAMQGPFGEELNLALMKELDIRWLLTKDSGEEGGCPEKCRAARRWGAGIVLIGRPDEDGGIPLSDAVSRIDEMLNGKDAPAGAEAAGVEPGPETAAGSAADEQSGPETAAGSAADEQQEPETAPPGAVKEEEPEAGLVAMGPGSAALLTEEAREWILHADFFAGSSRLIEEARRLRAEAGLPETGRFVSCVYPQEMMEAAEKHSFRRAAFLCSGDISRYSAASSLRTLLGENYRLRFISGVSSISYFLGKLGIPEEEVLVTSLHGRRGNPVPLIRGNRYVLVLTGTTHDVSYTALGLMTAGLPEVKITLGTELTWKSGRTSSGKAADFAGKLTSRMSLALFENPDPLPVPSGFGLPDEAFVRGDVPMTKREIRCAALSRLGLIKSDIVYDIGAGTGSTAVEAALHVPEGCVYAIERRREACALIRRNSVCFHCGNLKTVRGTAPDALADLPAPDAVFIGGSGGNLRAILTAVFGKNPFARVVLTSVSAETDAELTLLREEDPLHSYERVELIAVKEKRAGRHSLRRAENPVSIVTVLPSGIPAAEDA